MTLKAQKEERDAFLKNHGDELRLNNGALTLFEPDKVQVNIEVLEKDEIQDVKDNFYNLTHVEIDDSKLKKKKFNSVKIEPDHFQHDEQKNQKDSERMRNMLKQDIFCFYNLQVNLPKSFFDKLGQTDMVSVE